MAAGWSLLQLYGLDPVAPYARIGPIGGAFVASLRAHRVVAVDAAAIHLVTRTASRLQIYRGEIDDGAVLAWELRAPGFRHGISANVATSVAESLTLSR
jgi:hypothetical protein